MTNIIEFDIIHTSKQGYKFRHLEKWPRGRRHSPAKGAYELKLVSRVRIPLSPPLNVAPVAQLDRVSGYEPEGQEFESLRVRQVVFSNLFVPIV